MKIVRLTIANLKKKKGMAAVFLLLTLLSTLFLNLGLTLNSSLAFSFLDRTAAIQTPDLVITVPTDKYQTSFETWLKADNRVKYVEKEEIIYMETTVNSVNTLQTGAVIFNAEPAEGSRSMEPLNLLESDSSVPDEEAIYLPSIFKSEGAALGDSFRITFRNVDYTFCVAGFFETGYMGTNGYGMLKYYVADDKFQELYTSAGTGRALSVRLNDGLERATTSELLRMDFLEAVDYYAKVSGILAISTCLSYSIMEGNVISLLSVPIAMMIAVSAIVGIIVFITIFFKVKEEIEDSMPALGSLQAMGYTSSQLILSKAAEFILPGLTGASAGILCTYLIMPGYRQLTVLMASINVKPSISPGVNLLAVLLTFLIITCSSVLAAARIRRISPVTALRGGIRTHHFGRNIFPLGKGQEPLCLRLALKNMCGSLRPNLIAAFTIALCVFSIGITVILYANFGYDTSAVIRMTGIELSDLGITPLSHTDIPALIEDLDAMEEVRKTNLTDNYMVKINDKDVYLTVSEHFDKTETLTISNGTHPRYDNEIALSSMLLRRLDKKIGDSVSVTASGITRDYIITGTSLATNNDSLMGLMSLSGIQRMDPTFCLTEINVYLKDPSTLNSFTDKLYTTYSIASNSRSQETPGSASGTAAGAYQEATRKAREQISRMLDQYGMDSVEYAVMLDGELILSGNSSSIKIKEMRSLTEYLNGQLASYAVMMKGLVTVFLLVMLLIMGTIISITIHSMLRRQKEEFGIYKAIGYTTADLVKMICLQLTTDAVLGTALGSLLCTATAGRILHLLFSSLGLDLGSLSTPAELLVCTATGTILFIACLSALRAYQVKKITVYELLTE